MPTRRILSCAAEATVGLLIDFDLGSDDRPVVETHLACPQAECTALHQNGGIFGVVIERAQSPRACQQ